MALTKIRQEQGVVINEGSTDVDFRVESNAGTHALFVDGATNAVSFKGDGTNQIINSPVPSKGAWTQYYKDMTPSFVGGIGTYSPQADASVSGLVFSTYSGSWVERMRIDSSGRLLVGTTTNQGASGITLASGPSINLVAPNANSLQVVQFRNSNGKVGTITVADSATAYATSSDYRLKENVDYTWDATTRLKQLKPARFNFIVDDTNTLVDGFMAHEVSSIVPEAITGAKDAVDADNNPEYQGIDQSKLVPLLVKTIQELEARITALE